MPFSSMVRKSFRNRVKRLEDLCAWFVSTPELPAVGKADKVRSDGRMSIDVRAPFYEENLKKK